MGLRRAATSDLRAATGRDLVVVLALGVWLVYQWGFGNDALLPPIVANVADGLDDGATLGPGVAAVVGGAAAGAAFWAACMAIDGIVMAIGLRRLPNLVGEIGRRLRARGWVARWDDMRWSTRWILAYGAGPSALVLADALADGPDDPRRRRRIIATAVALSAGSVGVVAGVIVAAAVTARRFPATRSTADWIVRIASNPLFWIALFGGLWLVQVWRDAHTTDDNSTGRAELSDDG